MKNKVFFSFFFLLCGGVSFSQIIPNVNISTMSKTVNAIYKPSVLRDPLIPSTIYQNQTINKKLPAAEKIVNVSTAAANTSEYILVGIVQFSNKKEALIKDSNGNIYLASNGNLYDSKKNIVKGVKTYIKGKQLIILRDGAKPIELFIRGE